VSAGPAQVRGLVTADPVADWLVCRALLRTAAATPHPPASGPETARNGPAAPAARTEAAGRVAEDVAGCVRDVPRLERRIKAMRRRHVRDV
jgi:hypothetical protein